MSQTEISNTRDDYFPPDGLGAHLEARYNVHGKLMPLHTLDYDMVEFLQALGTYLNNRPTTTSQVSMATIRTETELSRWNRFPAMAPLVFGWWPTVPDKHGGGARSWVNPDYRHSHESTGYYVKDPERRLCLFDQMTSFGFISGEQIANTFGRADRRSLSFWVRRCCDESLGDKRSRGRVRSGRTFKTLNEWGYTYPEIGEAFGLPTSTVESYVRRYGENYHSLPPAYIRYQGDKNE